MNTKSILTCLTTVSLCASSFGAARSKPARVTPVRFPVAVEGAAPAAQVAGATGDADDSEVVRVKGKGCGATEEAALKDAYRDAVESAVGLYMDAEQMVKNDEVIKDQILTQSNAYIENYDIKEKKTSDDLVTITIWAQVRKQKLAKKIKAGMPSQSVQVGNTLANIHAVNETIEKRSADGASLLQNALNDFHPALSLVDFTLMSPEPAIVQSRFSKRGSGDGIAYPFLTQINMERYQQIVVERLKPVLSQISLVQPQKTSLPIVMEGRPDVNIMRERMHYSSNKRRKGEGPNMVCTISAPRVRKGRVQGPLHLEEPHNCLLVTGVNAAGTIAECEMYQLDDAARSAFGQWARSEKGPQYRVIFKGEDGSALYQEAMEASFWKCYDVPGWYPRSIMFAPWSLGGHNSSLMRMSVGEWRTVNVPREVQPNVRSITVEQMQ